MTSVSSPVTGRSGQLIAKLPVAAPTVDISFFFFAQAILAS